MRNFETSKTTEKEKIKYEAPTCDFVELDMESPVLQSSGGFGTGAEDFKDGGSYGRSSSIWD